MIDEQRETQKSVTGHELVSNFKLVGIHILEMYNPVKKFYAQEKGGKEKETTTKKKDKTADLATQINKQISEIKAS